MKNLPVELLFCFEMANTKQQMMVLSDVMHLSIAATYVRNTAPVYGIVKIVEQLTLIVLDILPS